MSNKEELIYWGKMLNQRSLVAARSGNISKRCGNDNILVTCSNSYLGQLQEDDIVSLSLEGDVVDGLAVPTSEKHLHLDVYNAFSDANAVIHAHSPNTVAFFMQHEELFCTSFEAEMYLGEVPVVQQNSPTVTDIEPVIEALKRNKIVVLGRHGVIAIGKDFKEAYALIEVLEEQAKVNIAVGSDALYSEQYKQDVQQFILPVSDFCKEKHISALKKLIDKDQEIEETAQKQNIDISFAFADDQNNVLRFVFEKGVLKDIDSTPEADCALNCSNEILRFIFNGEVNPYVAMVQNRAQLTGDFGLISLYYETLQCLFEFFKCCDFTEE